MRQDLLNKVTEDSEEHEDSEKLVLHSLERCFGVIERKSEEETLLMINLVISCRIRRGDDLQHTDRAQSWSKDMEEYANTVETLEQELPAFGFRTLRQMN